MATETRPRERDIETADYEPLHADEADAGRTDEQETQPAEEWGERLDTGKRIARGGKEQGHVPGAE